MPLEDTAPGRDAALCHIPPPPTAAAAPPAAAGSRPLGAADRWLGYTGAAPGWPACCRPDGRETRSPTCQTGVPGASRSGVLPLGVGVCAPDRGPAVVQSTHSETRDH